jgi:hypothetical protein
MATLYRTDGTNEEVQAVKGRISLEQAWEAVGGYVERVKLPKRQGVLLVDEDGLMKGLPVNSTASKLVGYALVGPVLHTKAEGWG